MSITKAEAEELGIRLFGVLLEKEHRLATTKYSSPVEAWREYMICNGKRNYL